ncbi:MAG: indolepyruvate oxidoreductase subunit beta [Methanobacterium sp.]|nr:indolepyruvate oxidoreductase subunit beta [Methanobacterium sp.]
MKPYNIYISGVGGQGIIKTSTVIGESAMKSNMSFVMSEVHGMAQRGGGVSTELKIGDAHSPIIEYGSADLLISFEPLEDLRAIPKISHKTTVIMNTSIIYPFNLSAGKHSYPNIEDIIKELDNKSLKVYAFNANQIAKESGHLLSMNMVMLGAAAAVNGFILEKEVVIDSMKINLPEKSLDINLRAFESGFDSIKSS